MTLAAPMLGEGYAAGVVSEDKFNDLFTEILILPIFCSLGGWPTLLHLVVLQMRIMYIMLN